MNSTPSHKISMRTVEILWTETGDYFIGRTFTTWAELDATMLVIASKARGGSYVKTGFRVTWADGETYEGRIDAREGDTLIREHMRRYCTFHSGRETPVHRTAEQWAEYLDACVKPEQRAALCTILDTYAI